MNTVDHFEQLRRAAHERGMADYEREAENARISGERIFKNNPFQNNHATDEAKHWNEGWANALLLAEQDCKEPTQDGKTWAAYVAGIIETYLNSKPVADEVREKAIAGIIERRLWALPSAATRVIGEIRLDARHHPFARLLTAYDENGNGWAEGTKIYAATAQQEKKP